MITLENFSKDNRSKIIGDRLYRIYQEKDTKTWGIVEIFNDKTTFSISHDYFSKNIAEVIHAFNNIKSERDFADKRIYGL